MADAKRTESTVEKTVTETVTNTVLTLSAGEALRLRTHLRVYKGRAGELRAIYDALMDARDEPSAPLKPGDKIRILRDNFKCVDVRRGDVLIVQRVDSDGDIVTDAPRADYSGDKWVFGVDDEGDGFERVREIRAGDRIRILCAGLDSAIVNVGDVLTVRDVFHGIFETNAPRAAGRDSWSFLLKDEGSGWERTAGVGETLV